MQDDIRIIKTVTFYPAFAKMDVEYYGFSDETLRRCVCCDKYHLIALEICPGTSKLIIEEARRQAEKENQEREEKRRYEKANEIRKKHLDNHLSGWRSNWRIHTGIIGMLVIYFLFAGISLLKSNIFATLTADVLVAIAVTVAWLSFWVWRDRKYTASVIKQANALQDLMLEKERKNVEVE